MAVAQYADWQVGLIASTCGVIVVGTIVGNVLVCTAVAIVRRLRTPSNLLIVSLAVSDLLVAVLVMPLAVTYETTGSWQHGQPVCDMWTSLDVMLCTASILNLCAISIDRYFAITRPFQYAMKRTPGRMVLMVVAAWVLSALISIPPLLFGGKADAQPDECTVSQELGYQLYATFGAFYLPLLVMVVIYYRIYMVSARLADAEARSKPFMGLLCRPPGAAVGIGIGAIGSSAVGGTTTAVSDGLNSGPPVIDAGKLVIVPGFGDGGGNGSEDNTLTTSSAAGRYGGGGGVETNVGVETASCNGGKIPVAVVVQSTSNSSCATGAGCLEALRRCRRRQVDRDRTSRMLAPGGGGGGGGALKGENATASSSAIASSSHAAAAAAAAAASDRSRSSTPSLSVKECKATRTLGVIMGAFMACWLPFFVLALVRPIVCSAAHEDCVPHWISGLFLWLGYANSFLNPIIYARFNREFRTPFKEILLFRCRGINSRLRTETYAEQFGLAGPRLGARRPPAGTSVVAMAAAAAVHTVVQYQDALRRTSVRVREQPTPQQPPSYCAALAAAGNDAATESDDVVEHKRNGSLGVVVVTGNGKDDGPIEL